MWTSLRNVSNPENTEFLATSSKQGRDQDLALLHAISQMFEAGFMPNFQELYGQRNRHCMKVKIPSYPWQRQRHYPSVIPSRASSSGIMERRTAHRASDNAYASVGPQSVDSTVDSTVSFNHHLTLNSDASSALRLALFSLYAGLMLIFERWWMFPLL